jgi:hypothetical protein
MKSKSIEPIPFLKEQQELAALFETEEVAQYFRNESAGSKNTPTSSKSPPEITEQRGLNGGLKRARL